MNVFVDASYVPGNSHVGFYNEKNKQMASLPIRATTSVRAEITACLLALKFYKNKAIIKTDCKPAHEYITTKYPMYSDNIEWIPRTQNKIADRLSKMYDASNQKIPAKTPDYRNYILTQPESKKLALYRNLATEDWQLDFVDSLEKQYDVVKKNKIAKFKHSGKFCSNGDWVSLIWMTNDHRLAGRGFFNYMKARGQRMDRQHTSKEFLNLLNTLKQKRETHGRKRNSRTTDGKNL